MVCIWCATGILCPWIRTEPSSLFFKGASKAEAETQKLKDLKGKGKAKAEEIEDDDEDDEEEAEFDEVTSIDMFVCTSAASHALI